jgi:hypothetical protein
MRTLSLIVLVVILTTTNALAQSAQLAPIPRPLPFQPGASVFQWVYQCSGAKPCGLNGFGLDRTFVVKSISIVLARLKVGENSEIPTYYFWATLVDGGSISGMSQNELPLRFIAINMKLVAAGAPGL